MCCFVIFSHFSLLHSVVFDFSLTLRNVVVALVLLALPFLSQPHTFRNLKEIQTKQSQSKSESETL